MGAGHHHHHHDHHGHGGHSHAPADLSNAANRRRLAIVLGLTLAYMGAEVVGGWLTGSLALLADAGHMLSDAGALALSFAALWVAQRPPDATRTFGYHRAEILAALGHAVSLLLVAGGVVWEAVERLGEPSVVLGAPMLFVACGGLVINVVGLFVLSGGQSESMNVRGAWLHVLTDALGSVGVIVSAALVWGFGLHVADPIASLVISILVAFSAVPLLKSALSVLMEGAPRHIDVSEVHRALCEISGVKDVHDLHIWTISEGRECLSGHVVTDVEEGSQEVLRLTRAMLADRFGVEHVTLQVEVQPCASEHVCS